MTPEGALLAGRFRLGRRLGAGTSGEVREAVDEQSGEPVAVKIASGRLPPAEARRRYRSEAEALSVLDNPHVVRLVAAGEADDEAHTPFLVLELLEGRTLHDQLRATGTADPAQVVDWLAQAAAALDLAHGVGIVHRDLKPENLFLHGGAAQVLKVLDFGLVKDLGRRERSPVDDFVGTPLYMAPEQVRGQQARVGPGCDVWAIGMIAITLLTGERYFQVGTTAELLAAIEHAPLYPPSTRWEFLPAAFDVWFARSTQRVVERRFRSVGEQVAALARALSAAQPRARRGREALAQDLAQASTQLARTPTPSLVRPLGPGTRRLLGRLAELAEVESRFAPGALLTVTGPAGVGKTSLAQSLCASAGERFADGAWLVALDRQAESASMAPAIARALELPADATRTPLELVAAALAPRQALLALDGLERVPDAAEELAELRRRCPQVTWLVTSRMRLGLAGEQALALEPLELPPALVAAQEALFYPAVQLFVERAVAVSPGFELTSGNVAQVIAICRQVDGLPLAIELAAAQVGTRSLHEIAAQVSGQRGGAPDAVRAAASWSYRLLDEAEQRLLRYLAIWPGGLTFRDLVERFGELGARAAPAVLRLLEANLVSWAPGEPPRLRLLETVRELCRAESRELGEEPALWRDAIAQLERLAALAEVELRGGAGQDRLLAQLDAEQDNLRAGMTRALAMAPEAALRIAGRLAWFWYLRGQYQEGATWLDAALLRAPAAAPADRARALHGAGRLALLSCRYPAARKALVAARDLAVAGGDRRGEAEAEQLLGSVAREQADYPAAERHHRRSLELWQALGDEREIARAQNYLSFLWWLRGDGGGAAEVDLDGGTGDDRETRVWWWLNLAAQALHAGDPARARVRCREAFAEAVAARFQEGVAWALDLQGRASTALGEPVQARAQLRASLRVHRGLGDLWRCASVLEALAALAVDEGEPARGALYLGAAEALRARIGAPIPACERAAVERSRARGAAALGDAFASGIERGLRTPLDEVVTLATAS